MIEMIQGFNVGSNEPIDKRLIITSNEVNSGLPLNRANVMPDMYIALCEDDGLYYVYDRATNSFTKASDFLDDVKITYYVEKEDGTYEADNPKSIIDEGTGGEFINYKQASLDANEIVKKSGLTIHFFNNPEEEYKLFAQLKDADGIVISESEMIDIPMEDAIKKIELSEDKTKIVATAISGETHEIAFSELYSKFDLVNQTDLANEKTRAETAEDALSNRVAVFEPSGAHDVAAFEAKEANDIATINAEIISQAEIAEKYTNKKVTAENARAVLVETELRSDLTKEVADRVNAVDTEKARSLSAESALSSRIDSEATRATAAENKLNNDLDTEVDRAKAAEVSITSALTSENARATAAEQANTIAIATEKARAEAKELEVATNAATALAAEKARAEAKEAEIITNYKAADTAEKNRAEAKEEALNNSILNEATIARAAELKLTNDLADEVSRAKSAELKLTNDLDSEITRAKAKEDDILEKLTSEIDRAKAKEAENTQSISTEKSRALGAESVLTTNLNNEITRASGAESTITSNLNSEIVRAKAAEQENAGNIALETSTARAAELTLTRDLSTEVSRAEAAEAGIIASVNSEVSARESADSSLQSSIDKEIGRAQAAEANNATAINTQKARIDNFFESCMEGYGPGNKLTTESFVSNAISTASATFLGTFNIVDDLGLTVSATHAQVIQALAGKYELKDANDNDYVFVSFPDVLQPGEFTKYDRYKYSNQAWAFEYTLNNSSFSQTQWDAINSGVDSFWKSSKDNADTSLGNRITTIENDYLKAADKSELNGSIVSEASIARAAEQANSNAISAEKTRAEGVEGALVSNLNAEINRATLSENEISTTLTSHKTDVTNPHGVTKLQVGLGNCDNTSDADKPVSTATQTKLDKKVDKVEGKSLLADAEITRLSTLANYDDTEVKNLIAGKQDIISDLDTIRSGAALGATAIQEHQSLTAYRTAADQDAIHDSAKQDLITETNKLDYSLLDNTPTIPTIPENVSSFNNDVGYLTEHQDITGKLDKIDYVVPAAPTDDGVYVLKCIVVDGNASYSWVAE